MHINTNCPDGTDRNCEGVVLMDLPFTRLTSDDVQTNWVGEGAEERLESIIITPPTDDRWLVENERHLSEDDVESITSRGFFEIESEDFPPHGSCSACGSSETYDGEGNNITAL